LLQEMARPGSVLWLHEPARIEASAAWDGKLTQIVRRVNNLTLDCVWGPM